MKIDKLEFDRRRPQAIERAAFLEKLDFRIKLLRNDQRLEDAIRVRHDVFNRHHADVEGGELETFNQIERKDIQAGCVLLVAESKLDNSILGSVRIETNTNRPLSIEHEVPLPESIRGRHLAILSRMSVVGGLSGKNVFFALSKAIYLYCLAKQINSALLCCPVDSLSRMYSRFGWTHLYGVSERYKLNENPKLTFSILHWHIELLRGVLKEISGKRAHDFLFEKFHPDIEIFSSVSSVHDVRRLADVKVFEVARAALLLS
jgi:hypothetical protein